MKTISLICLLIVLSFFSISCQKENPVQSDLNTDAGGSGGNSNFHRVRMTIVQNFDNESIILVDSVITSSLPNITPDLREFTTLGGSNSFDVFYYFYWQNDSSIKSATYRIYPVTNPPLPFYVSNLQKPQDPPNTGSMSSWSSSISGMQASTQYKFYLAFAGLQDE